MKAIVVVDSNWNIGKDGDLLTHLPTDLKYYKEKTLNKVIVIGRKTLESFPKQKPLPNRINLVLTANPYYQNENAIICVGLRELRKKMAEYDSNDIWISGGSTIYELFLAECDEIYVTKINKSFEADRSFHNLDQDSNFKLISKSADFIENDVEFSFCIYKNIKL